MSTAELFTRKGTPFLSIAPSKWEQPHSTYECHAVCMAEEEGGYSAFVRNLRGVHSQGETLDEALSNIREAFAGTVAAYLAAGEEIPWDNDANLPQGAVERQLVVRVDVENPAE